MSKPPRPFWSNQSPTISDNIWLPTDLTPSACSGAFDCQSWFTVERRCSPVQSQLEILWRGSTSRQPTEDIVTRTILIQPNRFQRDTLKKWYGVYRWTYNQCIQAYNDRSFTPGPRQKIAQQIELRHRFVARNAVFLQDKSWVLEVPSDVRDAAVAEFVQNLNTELSKNHEFKLKFKSRKDNSCSITVRKENWSLGTWFKTYLKEPFQGTEYVPLWLSKNSKLLKTKYNKFFLCMPEERQPPVQQLNPRDSIALDPGVRTFLTGYSPTGEVLEMGKNDSNSVFKMCYAVDRLMSKVSKAKRHKNRYQLNRAANRLREQIKNRVKDLHRKTAKYLCENYKTIFIPSFNSKDMVRKAHRKIRSKTVRQMLGYSHYAFRMHLLHKARDFKDCRVEVVDEAYTSKTCSRCGHIKNDLGCNKTFRCASCGLVIDRDINAARNIWIRSIQEVPLLHLRGLTPAGLGA
jgi:putative transposase